MALHRFLHHIRSVFTIFTCARPFTVSFLLWAGATSSKINSPGNIQVAWQLYSHFSFAVTTWGMHNVSAFTLLQLPTILQSGRSMVVGHFLTVHTFFYMHQSHKHDSRQPRLFTSWGALSSSRLSSCKQWMVANFWGMVRFKSGTISLASECLNHSATPDIKIQMTNDLF